MCHRVFSTAVFFVALVGPGCVSQAMASDGLQTALAERFRISSIEAQNPSLAGRVITQGVVPALKTSGVHVNTLRVTQINTKSPRFHVWDYAPVEIAPDGTLGRSKGAFSLPAGTRLVGQILADG